VTDRTLAQWPPSPQCSSSTICGSTEDFDNVRISLDGVLEIDLSAANAARLLGRLTWHVDPRHPRNAAKNSQVTAKPASRVGAESGPGDPGLGPAERVHGVGGERISKSIRDAFDAANKRFT
jgi:hypothetical protein